MIDYVCDFCQSKILFPFGKVEFEHPCRDSLGWLPCGNRNTTIETFHLCVNCTPKLMDYIKKLQRPGGVNADIEVKQKVTSADT